MTIVQTVEFLLKNDDYIIVTHENGDADGLGAQYALAKALRSIGKKVFAINSENYSHKYDFIDEEKIIKTYSSDLFPKTEIDNKIILMLDTSDVHFAGNFAEYLLDHCKSFFIIDHHDTSVDSEKNCLFSVMSSTCEIVYWLIKELKCNISKDMANAMFAGIVFDTGSFSYEKTTISTFEASLDLIKLGANVTEVHSMLYESSSVNVLLLRKKVLSTLEMYNNNKVAVQYVSLETFDETKTTIGDSDGLINTPLQASQVEVSILFKESKDGLRCSMRSKGKVNVAQIAQNFGGGGHKRAAGFKITSNSSDIKRVILEIINKELN